MIVSWRDDWLRRFFELDEAFRKIPPDIELRLFLRLQAIDDATGDLDLRSPPSNHFEKLSGHLSGKYSIIVNARWRLIFEWNGTEARHIYLDDHTYR